MNPQTRPCSCSSSRSSSLRNPPRRAKSTPSHRRSHHHRRTTIIITTTREDRQVITPTVCQTCSSRAAIVGPVSASERGVRSSLLPLFISRKHPHRAIMRPWVSSQLLTVEPRRVLANRAQHRSSINNYSSSLPL